ncbi:MAG: patatin family protein [Oscillospiraceae bacterium]|nr:patatin family protein [Oscillospiraceae bacterium]
MNGLVLEGGAMRGMFTAGVLDVFLDNGIKFDCIVGVSAGALFGVNLLSEQRGRALRYNKKYNGDKNYMGVRPLLKEGNFFSTEYAYDRVPKKLDPFDDEKFKASGIPFYAVVTNVESGEPEYIQIHSIFEQMDTLRASGSMPLVSKPVEINGKRYLDGGISDSIPFEWLSKEQGCDKLVVILTRDFEYRKKPMNKAIKLYGMKYPKIAEKMLKRHEQYNRSVEKLGQWENEGKAFVIRPSRTPEISRIEKDPDKLQSVYDLGINDSSAILKALKEYLG